MDTTYQLAGMHSHSRARRRRGNPDTITIISYGARSGLAPPPTKSVSRIDREPAKRSSATCSDLVSANRRVHARAHKYEVMNLSGISMIEKCVDPAEMAASVFTSSDVEVVGVHASAFVQNSSPPNFVVVIIGEKGSERASPFCFPFHDLFEMSK